MGKYGIDSKGGSGLGREAKVAVITVRVDDRRICRDRGGLGETYARQSDRSGEDVEKATGRC